MTIVAAKAWLEDLLANGPVVAKEIQQAAKAAGMAWITVRRAKDALSVVASKGGYQGAWQWRIKDAHQEDSKDAQVSPFDDAHHTDVGGFEKSANVAKDAQMSAFEELGIASLPARNADFVALVEANPRGKEETLVAWCRRIMALCDPQNVFLPRHFFARAREAAA